VARYGFDLDDCLTSSPEVAHLARALAREGHKVYVITASGADKKALKAKLYGLNVVQYHKILKVAGETEEQIGRNKGELCNKHGISVFFDNDAKVLEGFALTSKIARVQVLPSGDGHSPSRAVSCPCITGARTAVRCYHCPDFLENSEDVSAHLQRHHGQMETRHEAPSA
jgi:hypothetical protein